MALLDALEPKTRVMYSCNVSEMTLVEFLEEQFEVDLILALKLIHSKIFFDK